MVGGVCLGGRVNTALCMYIPDVGDIEKHMPGFLKVGKVMCSNEMAVDVCAMLYRPLSSGSGSIRCPLVNHPTSLPFRARPKEKTLRMV